MNNKITDILKYKHEYYFKISNNFEDITILNDCKNKK